MGVPPPCAAQGDEGLQDFVHVGGGGAAELFGHCRRGDESRGGRADRSCRGDIRSLAHAFP